MSADIIAAMQAAMVDVRNHGCGAERLSEIQQVYNLCGQLQREAVLAAERSQEWAAEGFGFLVVVGGDPHGAAEERGGGGVA